MQKNIDLPASHALRSEISPGLDPLTATYFQMPFNPEWGIDALDRPSSSGCPGHSFEEISPTPHDLSIPSVQLPLEAGVYDISVQPAETLTSTNAAVFSRSSGYGVVNAAAAVAQAIAVPTANFPDVANLTGDNWGLDRIKAPEVWAQGYTGQGVVVAVVDTGVDYRHPDLDSNIWTNPGEIANDGLDNDGNGFIDDIRGWDFVNNTNNPMDDDSHGTHVAGTIAAENNGVGVTGVAYNAKIMPVKVLGQDGGTYEAVAAGIRYAADNGAQVINLSLGGSASSNLVTEAVKYAVERGAVVVMASGNESRAQPSFPANLARNWGIAVGAIDRNDRIANFSNRAGRTPLDFVVAPGVEILSTTPNNTYSSFNGTSMATPHVAGVAALMLSANPNLSPTQIESILIQTATSS
ncbi:MAG: S8 family peptidase [Leptolyngbyaceae cyanobacterium bins.302]|nr:S8 family peptidase [Leptolyngbyaceae cyanobacterium bins.302]